MNLPPIFGYVIWLLLSEESNRIVKKWIGLLANKTGAPEFEPHLTLVRPPRKTSLKKIKLAADKTASSFNPLKLKVAGIVNGKEPYQSFFLKANTNPSLNSLRITLRVLLDKGSTDTNFNPHISLLYSFLTDTGRIQLKELIRIPDELYLTGNRLAVVRLNGEPDHWRIIRTFPLMSVQNS